MASPQQTTQPSQFIEVRDPETKRLLCRYNPQTHELEVKRKNERAVVVQLPPPRRENT